VVIFQPVRHTFLQQSSVVAVWSAPASAKVDRKWRMEVVPQSPEEVLALVGCKAVSVLLQ
jgi:hypothetical protein